MRTAAIRALRHRGIADGLLDVVMSGDVARITDVYEEWDTDAHGAGQVRIAGTVAVAASPGFSVAGLSVSFGLNPQTRIEVPFSVELPAPPVAVLLAVLCVRARFATVNDFLDLDVAAAADWLDLDGADSFADLDLDEVGDLGALLTGDEPARVTIGPVPTWLELPEQWLQRGTKVTDDDGWTTIEPDEDAPAVVVALGTVTLSAETSGFEATIEPVDEINLPPMVIAGTDIALEAQGISLRTDGDEAERGLAFDHVTVWGLGSLPFLPDDATLELTGWLLNSHGLTGHGDLTFPPQTDGIMRPRTVGLSFDRSWWPVELRAEAEFDLGALLGDTEHVVEVTADLRLDPHADPDDRWEFELAVRGEDDGALARLDGAALTAFGAACGALAVLSGGSGDASDAGLLLGALAALDATGGATGIADWEQLVIEGVSANLRRELVPVAGGDQVRAHVLRMQFDVRLAASLLPTGDDPIPIELGASSVTVDLVLDDVADLDRPRLDIDWSLADGLQVTLPAPVDIGGPITVTSASLRKRTEVAGLVIELGVDPAGASDVAIGGLPDVVVITYDAESGDIDLTLGRSGQQFTLLVPGALYAEGVLHRSDHHQDPLGGDVEWGEVLRGQLRAFLVANGDASGLDLMKKDSYLFDLEIDLLSATSADGSLQAFVVTLDAGFRPGLPIGTSGASIYGLGLTYAQNGAPAALDGEYGDWFFDDPPEYTTVGSKWVPQAGHWGFGASVTVGSTPDSGRSWNVGAGLFVLLPGPVIMVTGEGDLFAELPQLPAEGGEPDQIDAAFGAVIVLDLLRDRFSLDLRGELERNAGGKRLLHVAIPASVRVDLTNPIDFLVAIGMPRPEDDRVQVNALDLIDLSGYLVLAGSGIDLPMRGSDDLPLPGVALALGGAGGIDKGFSAGPVSLKLWARAGFDVGLSLSVPLLAGQVWVDGGIDVSAFGVGASLRVELTLGAIAPNPFFLWGNVRVVLGLPWFLPDIDFDASLEIGGEATWLENAPSPDSPVESLSLWGRGAGAPTVLDDDSGDDTKGVPLDVVPEVVFRVPVGNDTDELDAVAMVGADAEDPVWELATTGEDDDGRKEHLGYRHVLTACTLLKVDANGNEHVVDGVSATWPEGTENGNTPTALDSAAEGGIELVAGGQVGRTKLRLLDPLAATVDARIGLGAELTEKRWSGWDPCHIPSQDREDILRVYTFQPLAGLLERGGWRPPVLDVDIRPINPDWWGGVDGGENDGDDDDGDGRPGIRPTLPLPDIVLDRLPDVPDIRPVPPAPEIVPEPPAPRPAPPLRPGLRAEPRAEQRPEVEPSSEAEQRVFEARFEVRRPTDEPAEAQPSSRQQTPERGKREMAVHAPLRAALERVDAQVKRDEGDGPSLRAFAPLLAADLGLVGARLDRKPTWSPKLLTDPIVDTSSLPLFWAPRTGAATLEPGSGHTLPNQIPPDELDARLTIEPVPANAWVWERSFGFSTEPVRIGLHPAASDQPGGPGILGVTVAADEPVLGLPRLVLPNMQTRRTSGVDSREFLATMAAGALGRARIDLPYSTQAEATLLLAPGIQPFVWAVRPDGGEELLDVGDAHDFPLDGDVESGETWQRVQVGTNEPVVALRFAAVHGPLDPQPSKGRLPVAAALVGIEAFAPWRDRAGPAARGRDAYASNIVDMLDQRDAWENGEAAGVLEPATQYKLVVEGRSLAAKELPDHHPGELELGDGSGASNWEHTFTFRTADQPPASLDAHPGDAVAEGDPDLDDPDAQAEAASRIAEQGDIDELWQVATSPADGAPAHYLDDDLVVRLRDARTLAVLAAFDRVPHVRLIDAEGRDFEVEAAARLRAASDLPEHDEVVRDRLGQLPCLLPDGATSERLYQEAVLPLEVALDPGMRYVAELHAVEDGAAPDREPLHRWRFRASRWAGLAEHLAAHRGADDATVPIDEVVPDGAEIVAALTAKLAANGSPTGAQAVHDDETLDEWLVDTLGVPPRRAPAGPEIVLIWAWDHDSGTASAVGLLLDGPEPLLRDLAATVTLDGGDLPTRVVTGRSGARVLVVPEDGAFTEGAIEVAVSSRGVEATRTVVVPSAPAVLNEGDA